MWLRMFFLCSLHLLSSTTFLLDLDDIESIEFINLRRDFINKQFWRVKKAETTVQNDLIKDHLSQMKKAFSQILDIIEEEKFEHSIFLDKLLLKKFHYQRKLLNRMISVTDVPFNIERTYYFIMVYIKNFANKNALFNDEELYSGGKNEYCKFQIGKMKKNIDKIIKYFTEYEGPKILTNIFAMLYNHRSNITEFEKLLETRETFPLFGVTAIKKPGDRFRSCICQKSNLSTNIYCI